jgi:aryl-alcohol dehydrogenase-like predicted oxidoreductase
MSAALPGMRIEPSRICLGSAGIGTHISKDDSFAVMDAFFEAGGNFIDTAHIYAAWVDGGWGASERTIGEWIRSRGNRDRVVVGTKGAHSPWGSEDKSGRCSREDLEQHLNESLERLATDYVDLYWLHLDEPSRPVGEIIESLADLQHSGRILSYGASNWMTDRIEAANAYAKEKGLPPFVASQPWFSLGAAAGGPSSDDPTADSADPLRQWHIKTRLPMIPYASQANGYFGAGNVAWAKSGFAGSPERAESFDSPANRQRLLRAIDLAGRKNLTANQIALAYLLSQPFAVYPIIGTGNPDHAREALSAASLLLTEEECSYLFT